MVRSLVRVLLFGSSFAFLLPFFGIATHGGRLSAWIAALAFEVALWLVILALSRFVFKPYSEPILAEFRSRQAAGESELPEDLSKKCLKLALLALALNLIPPFIALPALIVLSGSYITASSVIGIVLGSALVLLPLHLLSSIFGPGFLSNCRNGT